MTASAAWFPFINIYPEYVVAGLAVIGGFTITVLGEYAGRRAPERDAGFVLIEH